MDKKKLWLLIGALVLVAVLVLILVAGSDSDGKERKKLPEIGLCLRQQEMDTAYGQLLEKTFTEAGFQVTVLDAKNDQTRQTEQIKDLLNTGVSLLVIEPVIADAAEDTVTLLAEKNVPAVFVGNKLPAALESWNRLSFVGSEDEKLGCVQGQLIWQLENRGDLNEDGQVSCLVITGPEDDVVANTQAQSCIDTLIAEGMIIDQMDTSWGEWTQASGTARCAKALSQFGKDIEVIICGNEAITLGAVEAVETGGWQIGKDYYLVGVGAEEKLHTGHMTGTVVCDQEKLAQQVLSAAQNLLNGKAVEKECYVNLRPVKAENTPE